MVATRVYKLAKELGVKSSAIIEKCQSEGLDQITNHMSTISAGLAATIQEWFSEGDNVTTIETAAKVDIEKVRLPSKPKRVKKPDETTEEQPEVIAEQPVEISVPEVQTAESQPISETEPVIEAPQEQQEQIQHPVPTPAAAVVVEPPKPPAPKIIVPAGPMMNKPRPAQLSGPRLVRIEAPEPVQRFTPKPRPRSRFNAPATEPLMGKTEPKIGVPDVTAKKPVKSKDRTHGRRHDDFVEETAKKTKFEHQRRQRDIEERKARLNALEGERIRSRPTRKIESKSQPAMQSQVVVRPEKAVIYEPIIVKDLSAALGVKTADIVLKLMQQGVMATANQAISTDVAELIALEFGTELSIVRKTSLEQQIEKEFEQMPRNNLTKRSVIATMLGHVDHGKTSLLDKIRSTQVAAGEAGGITQHIGAYQITRGDRKVTFLDTPGHEAFTAMRARGANMTDVAVLVVAADDGIMPQTIEAMNHAKAAGVKIVVALNKTDLPGWDLNRVYSQFAQYELTPTEWGGQTEVVKTSAVTGVGIDDLLEHVDYVSDLLELKADNTIPAMGWVVEAKLSAQRGVMVTLLVKEGHLNKGDVILAGCAHGRVKSLKDSFGKSIKTAITSMPVEVTGLDTVPQAGDKFYVLTDINKAKNAAEENKMHSRELSLAKRTQVTLENLFSQIEAGSVKELNLILRADVQGSVDVLMKYLNDLSTAEVKIKILHATTGGITEGDVVLAEASNAIVIGFNVVPDERVKKIAESKGVDVRTYTIIYRITEDLEKSMTGLLEPEQQEKSIGRAVVRNTFKVSKVGTIAGCFVTDGFARKKTKVRLIRNNVVIKDNLSVDSLKHFKDDAREVKAGLECGIKLANFDDVKVDDALEFFETIEVARTLR